jgi:hypothetical protein
MSYLVLRGSNTRGLADGKNRAYHFFRTGKAETMMGRTAPITFSEQARRKRWGFQVTPS